MLPFLSRRKRPSSPRLEPLEDRAVPSTFQVLNTNDSGAGSLRQAILLANERPGADQVVFSNAARGEIALSSGELVITDDLTIRGPGAHKLTVSGGGASRVFSVLPGAAGRAPTVTIEKLTIADGLATNAPGFEGTPFESVFAFGGGLYNLGGTVHLRQVSVTGNRAEGVITAGGGVANEFGGTTTVESSDFSGNTSAGLLSGVGGAISSDIGPTGDPTNPITGSPTLTVSDSSFSDNSATSVLGFLPLAPDTVFAGVTAGGAISNLAGRATVSNSAFTGNTSKSGDGTAGNAGGSAYGGALYSGDFSPFGIVESLLEVSHSTFVGNAAVGGKGGDAGGEGGIGYGGAINVSLLGSGVVRDSAFLGNAARGGAGGADGGDGGQGIGGGVAVIGGADMRIERSIFFGNLARGGAGGVGGNGGDGVGGGVGQSRTNLLLPPTLPDFRLLAPSTVIHGSTLAFNEASGGTGGAGGDGGDGLGGGVANDDGFGGITVKSELTLTRSLVFGNRANGGAGKEGGSDGVGQGGGLYNAADAALAVDLITLLRVRGNRASDEGDNVFGYFDIL